MQENNNADGDSNKSNENDNRAQHNIVWAIAAAGVAGVLIVLLISIFFPNMTERIKFFTANALSVLVLDVIVVQAYIYRRQWEAMRASLKETQKIVAQNERVATAAEQSAEIARESFYVGEAPYFGPSKIVFRWARNGPRAPSGAQTVTRQPELIITYMNGGKTPAWHFLATPRLELGEFGPVSRKHITMDPLYDNECPDAENTFYPSGAERRIKYRGRDEFARAEIEAINARTQTLFLMIEIGYSDMRDDRKNQTFLRCFNPKTLGFGDCGGRQD